MDFGTSLSIVQIILAVLLVAVLLIQAQGSSASLFGSQTTAVRARRGVEKVLFNATIVISALFLLIAIINARFG